jgi:LPS sulfotransferase NodH
MERTASANGVYGIQFEWHKFAYMARQQRRTQPSTNVASFIDQQLRSPFWVYVHRRDTAAQALSFYRAIYSGVWNERPDKRKGRHPRRPDLRQVAWLEDLLIADQRKWVEFFRRHRLHPLVISHNKILNNYDAVVAKVLKELGVNAPPESFAGCRPVPVEIDPWTKRWLRIYRRERSNFSPQAKLAKWTNLDVLEPRRSPRGKVAVQPQRRVSAKASQLPTVRFSCVVDTHPRFEYQSLIWALTLLHVAERPPSEIVVHVVKGVRRSYIAKMRRLGIEVVTVDPFDRRSPYSNKLRQLSSPALDADYSVLCDCDIAFGGDPSGHIPRGTIGAKVVGAGTPRYAVWVDIARLAGLATDQLELARSDETLRWTWAMNFNGGFLTVPRQHKTALEESWPRWLDWVIRHRNGPWPIGRRQVQFDRTYRHYADQISFGLAITDLGLPVAPLHEQINVSTKPPCPDRGGGDPLVLHFHHQLTERGLLRTPGVANIDRSVNVVNDLLTTKDCARLLVDPWRRWDDPSWRTAS